MGEVYQAEDTRKHRVVALKLISPQFSNNSVFRARMQREADTAGRLTEPHIVPIHDYGEIDGQFFVEMRLIDGASLRSLLKHATVDCTRRERWPSCARSRPRWTPRTPTA